MKPFPAAKSLLLLLSVVNSVFAYSQKFSDTIFFNDRWQFCDRSVASYYRIGTVTSDLKWFYYTGEVNDYFINGKIEMEGSYSDYGFKNGLFNFYSADGKIKATGNFENGSRVGAWIFYDANGNKTRANFPGDENTFVITDYTDPKGASLCKDGTGTFDLVVYDFYSNKEYSLKGNSENGNRNGEWSYYDNGQLAFKEYYKSGQFVKGESYSSMGVTMTYKIPRLKIKFGGFEKFTSSERFLKSDESLNDTDLSLTPIYGNTRDTVGAFNTVHIEPSYPGGATVWSAFIQKNLNPFVLKGNLPKKTTSIQQTVKVQFIVCTDGTVCEIKTTNDVLPVLKKEAERVIRLSGNWIPAIINGVAVKAYCSLEFTFIYGEQ
jgi:antitoxin component YwqK of YwqJK toxin-antitoxin module